ncbi:MAG: N-acetyltransferase [Candidatus Sericytochromatia bacterium]|nr:N-acetyltransferase [Candidatus Tanganyikabacteria bacterium]
MAADPTTRPYFVHDSSYVDEPCQIGKGTKIWHFSHVMSGAEIGEGCNIGQNVVVSPGVRIGNNVKIQNNVSVYTGVILEDDVFCGPSMVFTNVATPRSHVKRNDPAKDYLPTLVKRGASLGANCTVVCGNTIGEYAFVGAGAVVTRDVPAHAVVYGNPARIRAWACRCGVRLEGGADERLPDQEDASAETAPGSAGVSPAATGQRLICPECHARYRLGGERLEVASE